MLGKYIQKTATGRRFAIGDIHGCFETMRTLIEDKLRLQADDQLFLLGDYINRGPKQAKVLDYIMRLTANGYQVFPLRGNHEQMLLNDRLKELVQPYRDFLNNLLYYYETQDYYFVHAGLNFQAANPLEDTYAMLWMRESPWPDDEFLSKKKVVHGHTVRSLTEIKLAIKEGGPVLPIDNGCYRGLKEKSKEYGNLCALNLDSLELIVQENMDRL